MSRLLLHADILLDFVMGHRPESNEACRLFQRVLSGVDQAIVSASSLKDFYCILNKEMPDEVCRDWIRTFVRGLDVEPLDIEACAMALESDEPDYEDGCVRAIAERAGVDFIITRDVKAFARSFVKTYSAREFLELFDTADG